MYIIVPTFGTFVVIFIGLLALSIYENYIKEEREAYEAGYFDDNWEED